ncbi:MAG: hypothetical protein LBQ60_19280 [Bacteroidales bacterium]|jgi:hypothetical protein|nr:hypothetical protein [Bacteroidales bacterium]
MKTIKDISIGFLAVSVIILSLTVFFRNPKVGVETDFKTDTLSIIRDTATLTFQKPIDH